MDAYAVHPILLGKLNAALAPRIGQRLTRRDASFPSQNATFPVTVRSKPVEVFGYLRNRIAIDEFALV